MLQSAQGEQRELPDASESPTYPIHAWHVHASRSRERDKVESQECTGVGSKTLAATARNTLAPTVFQLRLTVCIETPSLSQIPVFNPTVVLGGKYLWPTPRIFYCKWQIPCSKHGWKRPKHKAASCLKHGGSALARNPVTTQNFLIASTYIDSAYHLPTTVFEVLWVY